MSPTSLIRAANAFHRDRHGVSAVEFALTLPVMLLLLFGGYEYSEAVAAYRKMTITTHTVADIATQSATLSSSAMSTLLNASAQVMVPYPTSNLTIILTEFTAPTSGQATVTWSAALNGTAMTQGTKVTLPAGVCQPGASIIRADITYVYTPTLGYALTGPLTMRDSIYMSPRQSQTINYPYPS